MLATLRSATIAIVVCTLVLGLAYPLVVTGIGQVLFPGKADGSLVERDGTAVGSSLLGQSFQRPVLNADGSPKVDEEGVEITEADPRYLQPRPSQTGYSGDATYFANRGPNSAVAAVGYRQAMRDLLAFERPYDPGLQPADVPADAVTFSGSGVDPHISEAYAELQAARIAEERRISRERILQLLDEHTDGRSLGVLGRPGVNVLAFNLALDEEAPTR